MTISILQFREWEHHPITKALKEALAKVVEDVRFEIQDPSVPFDPSGLSKLAHLHGLLEGIDLVLSMTFEELESVESIEDEEKPTTSGT